GLSVIPRTSLIYRMIGDIREWHATEPDWRRARERIAAHYGYDRYGGNCHIVPNHGLIILSLLYGGGDFQKSLLIANTSGWAAGRRRAWSRWARSLRRTSRATAGAGSAAWPCATTTWRPAASRASPRPPSSRPRPSACPAIPSWPRPPSIPARGCRQAWRRTR